MAAKAHQIEQVPGKANMALPPAGYPVQCCIYSKMKNGVPSAVKMHGTVFVSGTISG
jgi:hypothetical protein